MRFDILGKAVRVLMPALCAALLLPACSTKEPEAAPSGMTLTVNLRDVHRCSRISPEITATPRSFSLAAACGIMTVRALYLKVA